MIGKKGGGDYLEFFLVFMPWMIFFLLISFYILIPKIGGNSEYKIQTQMEGVSNNLLLYGYLRQEIGSKNMADLIAISYSDDDYSQLKEKTRDILKNVQKDVNFEIYIGGNKAVEECATKCKGKKEEFSTTLPIPEGGAIKFKLVLYDPKKK